MIVENEVLVEVSARHVHVTESTLKILFGEDAKLEVRKELSSSCPFRYR